MKFGQFSGIFISSQATAIGKLLGSFNYVLWAKVVEKWGVGEGLGSSVH